MKKYVFTYGIIAGLIIICSMVIGYQASGGEGFGASQVLGFGIMIIALSLIFFGVRRYRDVEQGGVIRFGRAFKLGVLISLVAAIIYVFVWEMYLHMTDFAFINDYTAGIIERKKAEGLSGEALTKLTEQMEVMKARYANPFYRMPVTFTEIFPVGLLVSLVAAFFLRFPKGKKKSSMAA